VPEDLAGMGMAEVRERVMRRRRVRGGCMVS